MKHSQFFISIVIIVFLSLVSFSSNTLAIKATDQSIQTCMTATCVDLFKQYKKYARARHSSAMYVLAEFYYKGYGTPVDKERAAKYYKRASIYDFNLAQFKVGALYLTDQEGMDKDKGVTYLKEAARNGHMQASYALGLIYSGNYLGESDYQQADKWLAKAIKEKHKKAIEYAQKLKNTSKYSAENYPKVSQQLLNLVEAKTQEGKQKLAGNEQIKSQKVDMPEDDGSNVLTIHGPSLEELMVADLARLKNTYPDGAVKGTGTIIRGRKCETCRKMDVETLKRMVARMSMFEASMAPSDL